MKDRHPSDEVVAAGGIVIDQTSEGAPLVLLVHRPKYNDWSFPKGKSEPNETNEEAAIREVKEETGLSCRIKRELEAIRYAYEGRKGEARPKVVYYFLMEAEAGRLAVNNYEIDRAQWFTLTDAMQALDYDHDKALLKSLIASGLR